MSCVVELLRSWSQPRALALAVIAMGAAACSAESTRFTDNPFASKPQGDATGSVPAAQTAPVARVETSQLPAPSATSGRPTAVASTSGIAGGGRGMASYTPGPAAAPDITGSVQAPPPPRKPASAGQWSRDGGTAVTVAPGDTIEMIAQRHGVPTSAIMQANGLTANAAIHPGQRLVIPRYNQASMTTAAAPAARPVATAPAKPAPALAATPQGNSGVHVVAQGETLSKISRLYGRSITDIARANSMEPSAKLNIGDRLVIPSVRMSNAPSQDASKTAQSKTDLPAGKTPPAKTPDARKQAANTESTEHASVVTPASDPPAPTGTVKAADAAMPSFRWPVKGRVIAGFGPKTNGQQNDGINLAVPEGTPIKAAEDGVVAYAGSELKGYGNLVLVRHSNGYVTAYAHAKELLVKRGDQIKRGQVIAKSGQTGNVDGPQLHFEIRKGPAPQDPMPLLSGA